MADTPHPSIEEQTQATQSLARDLINLSRQAALPNISICALISAALSVAHASKLLPELSEIFTHAQDMARELLPKDDAPCTCPACARNPTVH